MSTPHLYTIKITGKDIGKELKVVGDSNATPNDPDFVRRCLREAGIDTKLKKFDVNNYKIAILSSRIIKSL